MDEKKVIADSAGPVTVDSLSADLRRLGLVEGATVLVHSWLSSLGWVCGGAVAVVQALLNAVGSGGTLVVPTQTSDLSDPADWVSPPVPGGSGGRSVDEATAVGRLGHRVLSPR